MTPAEWRELVGCRVEHRRDKELHLTVRGAAKRAGVSEGLWRQVESGERMVRKGLIETVKPKDATKAQICGALGWRGDSIELMEAGGDPVLLSPSSLADERVAELQAQVDRLQLRVHEHSELLAQMTDEVKQLKSGPPSSGARSQ